MITKNPMQIAQDGWLSLGRWVTMITKNPMQIAQDGWLSLGRWVTKLVASATACYGSSLSSNPDISQKYKVRDISNGVAKIPYKVDDKGNGVATL